jgi:hypothetical protein
MWLSLAITTMALSTQLPLEYLPHAQGIARYALASEIGLLAGHACVLARALHRG